jgi:hypothetical protein
MAKQSKGIPGRPIITDEVRKIADLTADPRNAKRHGARCAGVTLPGRRASPTAVLKSFLHRYDRLAVELNKTGGDQFAVCPATQVSKQPRRCGRWRLAFLRDPLADRPAIEDAALKIDVRSAHRMRMSWTGVQEQLGFGRHANSQPAGEQQPLELLSRSRASQYPSVS